MDKQDITRRIDQVILRANGTTSASDDRLVADLLFDSLDLVDLAMGLEEEFQIEIPDDEWEQAGDKRICDLTDIVMAKLAAKEAA